MLAWFVMMNQRAVENQLLAGETSIAQALIKSNMLFLASLTILGLTTIAATALAVRRVLAFSKFR